jgi:hypothetical protein
MNIFILDQSPVQAALYQCDKHVVKMLLESAQMLSTAHRVLDGKMTIKKSKNNRNIKTWILDDDRENILYKSAHVNHPCSVWAREDSSTYTWLWMHFKALCIEYRHRFNKIHKSESLWKLLQSPPKNIKEFNGYSIPPLSRPFEVCISEEIYPGVKDINNPVDSYREYYKRKNAEQFEMKWTKRKAPKWMNI